MNDKIQSILKILIIIILVILTLVLKIIPEYKTNKGSSDTYIDTNEYESVIGISVNEKTEFLLVINKSKISNIMFLEKTSFCLYNKNIENQSISEGINSIVAILIENKFLAENSEITLTKYKEEYYEEIKNILEKTIQENILEVTYKYLIMTIEEKATSLALSGSDEKSCIKEIELYSKEIIRYQKNNVSAYSNNEAIKSPINSTTSKKYADAVYEKITHYAKTNEIISQEVNSSALPINLIPADAEGTIYPAAESWYYIKDNKVYAYIVIEENKLKYSYCYQGEIGNVKEGVCE